MDKPDVLSVKQVAEELDLSETYVRELCQQSRLSAFKLSDVWLIPRSGLEQFKATRRPPGRPPKSSEEEE